MHAPESKVGNIGSNQSFSTGDGTQYRTPWGETAWTNAFILLFALDVLAIIQWYAQSQSPQAPFPALWLWTAEVFVVIASLGLMLWFVQRQRPVTWRNRILAVAVDDGPVSESEQDKLGFVPVVEALATFMRHRETRPPITFAITAPWGRGKSSFMRLLQARLDKDGIRTVWFNAWHHQKEPVMLAALLEAITRQATPPWLSVSGIFFRANLLWQRFCKQPWLGLVPWLLANAIVAMLLISVVASLPIIGIPRQPGEIHPVIGYWATIADALIGHIFGNAPIEQMLAGNWQAFIKLTFGSYAQNPAQAFPVLGMGVFLVGGWLLFFHFLRPFPASPAALLASLGGKFSLLQAEEQTCFRQRFRDHFSDVCHALQPFTLTIFIDDLDRCEAAKSAEMLEAVNYLVEAGKCFVVLGIASEIVEAQLGDAYKDIAERHAAFSALRKKRKPSQEGMAETPVNGDKSGPDRERLDYARNYLHKLIQIEIPIPHFSPEKLRDMLTDEATEINRWNRQWEKLGMAWRRIKNLFKFLFVLAALIWCAIELAPWVEERNLKAGKQHDEMLSNFEILQKRIRANDVYIAWLEGNDAGEDANSKYKVINRARHVARLQETKERRKHLDSALIDLEGHLRSGRINAFADQKRIINNEIELLKNYIDEDVTWQRYQANAVESAITEKPKKENSTPEINRTNEAATTKPVAQAQADFPLDSSYLVGYMALLLIGFRLLGKSRQRYQIETSEDYQRALAAWQPVLLSHPHMRAPRETKRFLNLSRYLTLRINADEYVVNSRLKTWLGNKLHNLNRPSSDKAISESAVVGLTALYLAKKPDDLARDYQLSEYLNNPEILLQPGVMEKVKRDLGSHPLYSQDEVALFLATVGEIEG